MDKIYCKCGCGELIDRFNKWGRERMYAKNGHQFRGKTIRFYLSKYKIDTNFFQEIGNAQAYILGYLFADGCMMIQKKGRKVVSFATTDKELLDMIKRRLKTNIRTKIRPEFFRYKDSKKYKCKTVYSLTIRYPEITEPLFKIGLIPRKTQRLKIPNIVSNKLFFHFLRGFFDGDGSVMLLPKIYNDKYKIEPHTKIKIQFTSASREFLISIKNKLEHFGINSKLSLYQVPRLTLCANLDKKRFYEKLYRNSNHLFLGRKKQLFDKFFSTYKEKKNVESTVCFKEWNFKKNSGIDLERVSYASNRKVWWKCKLGHEWKSRVSNRVFLNQACPFCAGKLPTSNYNLKTNNNRLAKEWHYEKNFPLVPNNVMPYSHRAVWWFCKENHEWKSSIYDRNKKNKNCPICYLEKEMG